jgi:hypothetical protein
MIVIGNDGYDANARRPLVPSDHQCHIFSWLKRLGDAVGRRGGLGEFVQGRLFELAGGEARADLAAGRAFGFQLLPEPLNPPGGTISSEDQPGIFNRREPREQRIPMNQRFFRARKFDISSARP